MGDSRHTAADDWQVHRHRPIPAVLEAVKEMAIDELHQRLGEAGFPEIRGAHGCVFRFIESGGSRLTDLAERSGLTKQAVGQVVSDLEELGHLERVADPQDGRAKIIRLTERGGHALAAAERIFADIEARWASEFGERRMATTRATLEAIAERQRAAAAPPR